MDIAIGSKLQFLDVKKRQWVPAEIVSLDSTGAEASLKLNYPNGQMKLVGVSLAVAMDARMIRPAAGVTFQPQMQQTPKRTNPIRKKLSQASNFMAKDKKKKDVRNAVNERGTQETQNAQDAANQPAQNMMNVIPNPPKGAYDTTVLAITEHSKSNTPAPSLNEKQEMQLTEKAEKVVKENDEKITKPLPNPGFIAPEVVTDLFQDSNGNLIEVIKVTFTDKMPIGAELKVGSSKQVRITRIVAGRQAEYSGVLQKRDILKQINGKSIRNLTPELMYELLRNRPVKIVCVRQVENSDPVQEQEQEAYFVDVFYRDPEPPVIVQDENVYPQGGWRWRPAKLLYRDELEQNAYVVEFTDEMGGNGLIVDNGEKDKYSMHKYKSKSPPHVYHHDYRRDDVLDVYHIFPENVSKERWHKCQVLNITPYYIFVHFVDCGNEYDSWIHTISQKHKLAPFCTETERAEVEADNREKQFVVNLRRNKNLEVIAVEPDGNCLFRAVAYQVLGDQDLYDGIRKLCCDYMETHKDRFAPLVPDGKFEDYVMNMRQDKVWGDDPEIRAIEELFDRPIQIFSSVVTSQGEPTCEPIVLHFEGDLPDDAAFRAIDPIKLSFHGNNHYNAVTTVGQVVPFQERDTNSIQKHRTLKLNEKPKKTKIRRKKVKGKATLKTGKKSAKVKKQKPEQKVALNPPGRITQ